MEAKTSGGGAWKSRRAQAREEKEGGAAEAKGGSAETEAKQSDSLLLQVAKYFKDQAFGAESGEGLEVVYEEFICPYTAETAESVLILMLICSTKPRPVTSYVVATATTTPLT